MIRASCINIITNWLYILKCKINETSKTFFNKKKIPNWDLWEEIKDWHRSAGRSGMRWLLAEKTVLITRVDMIDLYSSSVILRTLTSQEFSYFVLDLKPHWSPKSLLVRQLDQTHTSFLSLLLFNIPLVPDLSVDELVLVSSIYNAIEFSYYGSSDSIPITNQKI